MIWFPSRCYNGGQQHRFQPRFSKRQGPALVPDLTRMNEGQLFWAKYAIENSHESTCTYHGDVCKWCGKVVNEQQTGQAPPRSPR